MLRRSTRLGLAAALFLSWSAPAFVHGQEQGPRPGAQSEQRRQPEGQRQPEAQRLPPESVTQHRLSLPGRTLSFTATAGHLTLTDQAGAPQAEYGFTAYILEGAEPGTRPVTFAVNGGPGASSAYLHLLAIGPWLLPVEGQTISPSMPTNLVPNGEAWLDFTDLVFIDPPGTGFSRVVGGDQVRERFYSVEGDIDGLAAFVTRFLKEKNRLDSPKFFVGESYGGFRGPLLAQKLQNDQGIGLSGLFLVSPVLDFGWFSQPGHAPWVHVTRLPSMAAAALEAKGGASRERLRDVERYAANEYLVDLLRGLQDKEAIARVSDRVSELTGLDPALVRRLAGRVDMGTFQREFRRSAGLVVSAYDTNVVGYNPEPNASVPRFEDPGLTSLTAPLTTAILHHLGNTLKYRAEGRYEVLNGSVNGAWRWGRGRSQPESLSEMRQALALDPKLRVLIVHGFTDLVTPYFSSQLLLNQLPEIGPAPRATLQVYGGGHMFYTRSQSRQAFRTDAEQLIQESLKARVENGG